ncbi:MAG: hypothetical protein ABSD62_06390 [Candidatus Limnocylindrales bacterium]|jgi:hypothetical protein
MLYRPLSAIGAIAHLPDAAVAPLVSRNRPGAPLVVGGARFAMPFILGAILALACGFGVMAGNEGAANPNPTDYTASGLAQNPDLHGRLWAIVRGTIDESYVDSSKGDGTYG